MSALIDSGLAVRRQLPQRTDPDAGRLLGVVFEAVVPVGMLEPELSAMARTYRESWVRNCSTASFIGGGRSNRRLIGGEGY